MEAQCIMLHHESECSSGEHRYRISDQPIFTQACHCKLCQRYSASTFVVHSVVETENPRLLSGNTMTTVWPTENGGGHIITRCKTCRDQISSFFYRNKKVLVLRTKNSDNGDQYPPQAHTFTKGELDRVMLSKSIAASDERHHRENLYAA